jgi:AGZA family xanthine/uracil permease-like MFS transporter
LLALGQGGLLTSMLWAATLALVIDRRFVPAAGWLGAAAIFAAFGVIHAYRLTDAGVEGRLQWGAAPAFALSYAAGAAFLLWCGWYARRHRVA